MLRHLTRIVVLAAALGAALAFSGSALAAPTKPNLFPIPTSISASGDLIVQWTASTFDPGFAPAYELTVKDAASPSADVYITSATSQKVPVLQGHQYTMCVRAVEKLPAAVLSSAYDCEATAAGARLRVDVTAAWPGRLDFFPPDFIYTAADAPFARALRANPGYRPYDGVLGVYVDAHGDATPVLG
jgi:hypothetical protein